MNITIHFNLFRSYRKYFNIILPLFSYSTEEKKFVPLTCPLTFIPFFMPFYVSQKVKSNTTVSTHY